MTTQMPARLIRWPLLAIAATALVACQTTPSKPTPARIEVEEAIGFTIIEESPVNNAVRTDYRRAQDVLGQGNLDEGIAILEEVTAAAPALAAPRIDLAIAYHRSGNLEAAEQHLQQALEINPRHPIVLNELGIVYRKTARFAEARSSYAAALDVYPGYHYARRNLAVLCDLYLNDLNCAKDNYEAYLATVHSDDEASMWLKAVRYRLGITEGQ